MEYPDAKTPLPPPTYHETMQGKRWYDLAAPYMPLASYATLSRVSRAFYDRFHPRLWNDPMLTAIRLRRVPFGEDLKYLAGFVRFALQVARLETRRLVNVVHLRPSGLGQPLDGGMDLDDVLRLMYTVFPAQRCIMLGRVASYDPAVLVHPISREDYPRDGSFQAPLMLDVSHCAMPLPAKTFDSPYWRRLVYLDLSYMRPGSLDRLVRHGTFNRRHCLLPRLAVLKLRGLSLTPETLRPVLECAGRRVWSLDLADNDLSDDCVEELGSLCNYLRNHDVHVDSSRFEAEGRRVELHGATGSSLTFAYQNRAQYIQESDVSADFASPLRWYADPPNYKVMDNARLVGTEPPRSDDGNDIRAVLCGHAPYQPPPDWDDARDNAVCQLSTQITHLCLSGNPRLTADGIWGVLCLARGHLERFENTSPFFGEHAAPPSFSAVGIGLLGHSHLFRPVFSANLQTLGVHHTLVTHVPTLLGPDGKQSLDGLHYAETVLRARTKLVFPRGLVPDLNPRLQSLTLTGIPLVSSGPLIDSLLGFLTQLGQQETGLYTMAAAHPGRRGATLLKGLRHLCLEFVRLPSDDDSVAVAALANTDARAMLEASDGAFSFFDWESTPANAGPNRAGQVTGQAAGQAGHDGDATHAQQAQDPAEADPPSGQLPFYPLPGTMEDSEFVRFTLARTDGETGKIPVNVWVGSGSLDPDRHPAAVRAYMRNLADPDLWAKVRPATPDHVLGGVPEGVFVFGAAWDARLDFRALAPPQQGERVMRSVPRAITEFRKASAARYEAWIAASRAHAQGNGGGGSAPPRPDHWTGRLSM